MRDFEQFYSELLKYQEQHGNLMVPQAYVINGYKLGKIVSCVRGEQYRINEKERERLNNINFVWRVHAEKKKKPFSVVCHMLLEYKEKYGTMNVPIAYVTDDGVRLGALVNSIRTGSRKTTDAEKAKLNKIGFSWKAERGYCFKRIYEMLILYKEEFGNLKVPMGYKNHDGVWLGRIVYDIRRGKRKMTEEQKTILSELGLSWKLTKISTSFEDAYNMIVTYKEEHGDCYIPNQYVTQEGVYIGRICYRFRKGIRKLTEEQRRKLDKIGFNWDN